jgi:hypothetical protein
MDLMDFGGLHGMNTRSACSQQRPDEHLGGRRVAPPASSGYGGQSTKVRECLAMDHTQLLHGEFGILGQADGYGLPRITVGSLWLCAMLRPSLRLLLTEF